MYVVGGPMQALALNKLLQAQAVTLITTRCASERLCQDLSSEV